MSATYQFYLDGTLLADEPQGWDNLINVIERKDDSIKGIFATMDVQLQFKGDGYVSLLSLFNSGFCGTKEIEIKELDCDGIKYNSVYDGILFASDCTFDINQCYCDVKLRDNSFYSKINNNKSVKTFVEVGFSKNGVAYTGANDYVIHPFNPCIAGGIWIATYDRHCVTFYEAFRSLVAFMTDDTIDFDSQFYGPSGAGAGYCITDGLHLSSTNVNDYSATTNIQKICFQDLFSEAYKLSNIAMMVDMSGARPKLIIEPASYFKNSSVLLTMNYVRSLKASVNIDTLFAQLHFGGKSAEGTGCPSPGLAFPNDTTFITFKDETFYVLGTCNIDSTLDLSKQWYVDSNTIQDCVVNGSTDYDEDIFILETTYNYPGISLAVQGNPFNLAVAAPRFYNPSFMNNEIALKFLGAVPNTIAQALNNVVDDCYIWRTQTDNFTSAPGPSNYTPVVFNDKTTPPYNDPGGNFTLATGRYTAPTGGLYKFNFQNAYGVRINSSVGYPSGIVTINIKFNQFDSFLNPVNSSTQTITIPIPANIAPSYPNTISTYYQSCDSILFAMATGDFVDVEIEATITAASGSVTMFIYDAYFKTIYTSNGGGYVQQYNPSDYSAYSYDFEYPLSRSEFQKILDQPNYSVQFNVDGINNYTGFIKLVKYSRKTSIAQFTCIASKSLSA